MPLTPEQEILVSRLDRSLCVVAGAGTGKTRVLVERFLRLLESGVPPERIAAITFTRKAAAEMLDRLRQACRQRAAQAPDHAARRQWLDRLDSLAAGYIGTIHSFCSLLLKLHPVEAAIDPRFEVVPEDQVARLVSDSVQATVERLASESDPDLARLTSAYSLTTLLNLLRAAVADRTRLLRAASIDSGGAMAAAVCRHVSPEDSLAALHRLADEAIAETISALDRAPDFHRAAGLLAATKGPADDGREISRELAAESLRLMADPDPVTQLTGLLNLAAISLLKRGSAKKWPSKEHYDQISDALKTVKESAARAAKQCEDLSDRDCWPADLQLAAALSRVALQAVAEFSRRKTDAAILNEEDLLLSARDLLRDHPAVRRRLAARFTRLLVDELQDTDHLQMEILNLLLSGQETTGAMAAAVCRHVSPETAPKIGTGAIFPTPGSLFAVGDPKQSIYRFRGAEVSVFRRLVTDLGPDGSGCLSTTFRFHQGLADFFNALFQPLLGRDFAPLDSARQDVPPVSAEILLAQIDPAEKVNVAERRRREAARLAHRIQKLNLDEGVAFGQIAILMSSYTHLHHYEDALRRLGLPYYLAGGRRFFEQREIRDVLTALRAIQNPSNQLALAALLRSPFFGLSDDGLLTLRRHGPDLRAALLLHPSPLGEGAALAAGEGLRPETIHSLSPSDSRKAARFTAWLDRFTTRAGRISVAQLLQEIVFDGGFAHALLPQFLGDRRYANLRRLIDLARQFDASGRTRLEDFLAELEASLAEGVPAAEAPLAREGGNAVLLMTVHAAKGLEFPYVFLAGADAARGGSRHSPDLLFLDEVGPAPRRPDRLRDPDADDRDPAPYALARLRDRREEADEFKRLLYVAATRAQDRLIICGTTAFEPESWLAWIDQSLRLDLADSQTGSRSVTIAKCATITIDSATAEPLPRRESSLAGVSKLFAAGLVVADISKGDNGAMPAPQAWSSADLAARLKPIPANLAHLRLSATALAEYDRCPALFHYRHVLGLRDYPTPPTKPSQPRSGPPAAAIGTLVHRALAALELPAATLPKDFLDRALSDLPDLRPADRPAAKRAVTACLERFRAMPLAHHLSDARQTIRELPFALDLPGATLTGTLDLLYQDAHGDWNLVDYKTDHVTPARLPESALHYRAQLLVYREAAQRILAQPVKSCCLAFLSCGILYDTAPLLDSPSLTSLLTNIAQCRFSPRRECHDPCCFAALCRLA